MTPFLHHKPYKKSFSLKNNITNKLFADEFIELINNTSFLKMQFISP